MLMLGTEELESFPVLSQGWTDNLHVESRIHRVWLSRLTLEDEAPYENAVTVETLMYGRWTEIMVYDGDNPPPADWSTADALTSNL
jgi:hypothetical protein